MTRSYFYEHGWEEERARLAGLEAALDPGTRAHLLRLGVGPGWRCLEVGAGGGAVAFWLAEQVEPGGTVLGTDIETDFLQSEAGRYANLEVRKHDITAESFPTGFDLVHARYLIEWLPDKRLALERLVAALRLGGVLLDEEPDWVTIYEAAEPRSLRHVVKAAMRHLESTTPIDCEYGRKLLRDLLAIGLQDAEAEGRCPIVRGGSPPAADFLRLTLKRLRDPLLAAGTVTIAEFDEAVVTLEDPSATVVMPMTVAVWGTRK